MSQQERKELLQNVQSILDNVRHREPDDCYCKEVKFTILPIDFHSLGSHDRSSGVAIPPYVLRLISRHSIDTTITISQLVPMVRSLRSTNFLPVAFRFTSSQFSLLGIINTIGFRFNSEDNFYLLRQPIAQVVQITIHADSGEVRSLFSTVRLPNAVPEKMCLGNLESSVTPYYDVQGIKSRLMASISVMIIPNDDSSYGRSFEKFMADHGITYYDPNNDKGALNDGSFHPEKFDPELTYQNVALSHLVQDFKYSELQNVNFDEDLKGCGIAFDCIRDMFKRYNKLLAGQGH